MEHISENADNYTEIDITKLNPETIAIRSMPRAVKQKLEDQLLPPINVELRSQWMETKKQCKKLK